MIAGQEAGASALGAIAEAPWRFRAHGNCIGHRPPVSAVVGVMARGGTRLRADVPNGWSPPGPRRAARRSWAPRLDGRELNGRLHQPPDGVKRRRDIVIGVLDVGRVQAQCEHRAVAVRDDLHPTVVARV